MQKIQNLIKDSEFDSILISNSTNRRYVSGFTGSSGYLLITVKECRLCTDSRYFIQAENQSPEFEIIKMTNKKPWPSIISQGLDIKSIAFESEDVTVDTLRYLEKNTSFNWIPASRLISTLRSIKDKEEINLIQKSIDITDNSFNTISENIKPGMTEKEISWEIEKHIRGLGAESLSFDTIVASGPNSAKPHHSPSDRKIRKGEPIVIDMGSKFSGYCSDLTRTIYLGKPDKVYNKIYDTVFVAQLTAIETLQKGMTGKNIDNLARSLIKNAGFGNNFGHSLGHGVGLEVHENPSVGPTSENILEENMVFTVEPGIYIENWGGVRIEDMVMIENGETKIMSKARKVKIID